MRLSKKQQNVIKSEILAFDSAAQTYLFGSRADDRASGGDIDLLVVSQKIDFATKLKILAQMMIKLGEQKIDLVIVSDTGNAFAQVVIDEGILL